MDKYFYYSFCSGADRVGDYDFERTLEKLAKTCNGEFSGAVFGGVKRDYGFIFKTERSARKFNAALGRRAKAWNISDRRLNYTTDENMREITL